MEEGEHRNQEDKQWCNAGKAEQVEVSQVDTGKRTPAPERSRSNEKAGDREENLNAGLTVPNQRGDQLVREALGVIHMGLHKSYVDVVHQHEEDRKAAKHIDALKPRPAGRRSGWAGRHFLLCRKGGGLGREALRSMVIGTAGILADGQRARMETGRSADA